MTIFEKIIKKEVPSDIIYEDDKVIAILDYSQLTKGHTLVMPKKHCVNILDVDAEELSYVMTIVQKLSHQLIERLDAKGVNVITNANEVAGQSVMHFHVHIIPRYDEHDEIQLGGPSHLDYDKQAILKQIKGL